MLDFSSLGCSWRRSTLAKKSEYEPFVPAHVHNIVRYKKQFCSVCVCVWGGGGGGGGGYSVHLHVRDSCISSLEISLIAVTFL